VVIYKTGLLTYLIARKVIDLDKIAMVNIVAGYKVVPELIQRDATAESIAAETIEILGNQSRYDQMVADLIDVRKKLGAGNAGKNAFMAIKEQASLC
jgi:lipid-A-disaccharide synthase